MIVPLTSDPTIKEIFGIFKISKSTLYRYLSKQ
ncbi:MAG: helix-turn-helix domain-containing protein [Desulfobulbaceae bacterium]|nr:helix-turn-helix domain-containing protein [Desulfobulbaceae bacterium]